MSSMPASPLMTAESKTPVKGAAFGTLQDVASERLCNVCEEVDFERFLGEKMERVIDLGKWSSISSSTHCPFCRLVTHSLQSNIHQQSIQPSTTVFLDNELSWKLGVEPSPYDRSKSESFSNKFDLRSRAKRCQADAYRFTLSLRAEDSTSDETNEESYEPGDQSHRSCIQYLAHTETEWEDLQFFGRMVNEKKIDTTLLSSWLNRCEEYHLGDCENDNHGKLPSSLRLVNVDEMSIVKAPLNFGFKYVTLSYVWGTETMEKSTGMKPVILERRNIVRGSNGEESTPLPEHLPKTISDAIYVTRLLGYKYLWVDALCIVQDDPFKEKILHLTSMKAIYCCASLTIAAAAGLHADHGLPGIGVPRAHKQHTENIDGLIYSTMFPSYTELHKSDLLPWNTRGWTFQEKLLSRRILFFTDYQVYFHCAEAIWTEEIIMETGQLSKSVEARQGKYSWQSTQRMLIPSARAKEISSLIPQLQIDDDWGYLRDFVNYTTAIREYTKRTLTDANDMLFAIDGVLEAMKSFAGNFLHGLQEKHMLESLQWYPQPGTIHRHITSGSTPSWTWASSTFPQTGVNFDLMDVRELRGLSSAWEEQFREFYEMEQVAAEQSGNGQLPQVARRTILVNLLACLMWPVVQKDHTITQMFISDGVNIRAIDFTFPISAFSNQDFEERRPLQNFVELAEWFAKVGKSGWTPPTAGLPKGRQVLMFKTVIVSFRIGRPLYKRNTNDENEVGVFELLNGESECVGEVITTYRLALDDKERFHDFLTISWGFSLQHAQLEDSYIPTWTMDAEPSTEGSSDESKFDDLRMYVLREIHSGKLARRPIFQKFCKFMPKSIRIHVGEQKRQGRLNGLFSEVRAARNGQQRPRSLWPIVNLMMVQWEKDSGIAKRAGIGRVIMKAWQEIWNPRTEVWLA